MTKPKTTPSLPTGATHIRKAAEVFYKHVCCIPVWNIDQTEIVWYYLYTNEGYWLGRITHLRYLEEANASKVKV